MMNSPSLLPPQMVECPEAIFLDRDGVINVRRIDHVTRWEEFSFLPGAKAALAQLAAFGVPIFVITNQAIINRGIATRDTVEAIHARMCAEIADAGGAIVEVFFCPHRPDERCNCRKPAPGMLRAAATKYGFNLRNCVFVGDTVTDLLAGEAAGCPRVLVLTGQGREEFPHARTRVQGEFRVVEDLPTLVQALGQPGHPFLSDVVTPFMAPPS